MRRCGLQGEYPSNSSRHHQLLRLEVGYCVTTKPSAHSREQVALSDREIDISIRAPSNPHLTLLVDDSRIRPPNPRTHHIQPSPFHKTNSLIVPNLPDLLLAYIPRFHLSHGSRAVKPLYPVPLRRLVNVKPFVLHP